MNVWAKVNGTSGVGLLGATTSVFAQGNTVGSYGIGMTENVDGTLGWRVGSRAISNLSMSVSYTAGDINYITFIYTPTFQYVYRNGILITSLSTSSGIGGSFTSSSYAIGINRAVPGGNGVWMDGSVYCASIYNRDLSATEVLQNYNATKSRFGLI
jgi:hypothetical protein